jgi:hypothetical protein
MKSVFFKCKCRLPSHVLHVDYDDANKELSFGFYLNPAGNIWDRLLIAAQYVLGFGKNWHFDDFVLHDDDVVRLSQLLEPLLPAEPALTEQEGLSKITLACEGKEGDEACCALVALRKNGYELTKVDRKEGFDLKLRRKTNE